MSTFEVILPSVWGDIGRNNMNEREKIKEILINAKIYDPELPQKAVQAPFR